MPLLLSAATSWADPLGPSPTEGMDRRTAELDIRSREAYSKWRVNGNWAYHELSTCLEAQKKTSRDLYSAIALCQQVSGVR